MKMKNYVKQPLPEKNFGFAKFFIYIIAVNFFSLYFDFDRYFYFDIHSTFKLLEYESEYEMEFCKWNWTQSLNIRPCFCI